MGTSDAALSRLLFEGTKNRIDEAKEKSVQDTLEAGGTVAYVIAAIGVFGLCLAGLRASILQRAGRERYEQAAQVIPSRTPKHSLWPAVPFSKPYGLTIGQP